MKKIIPFWKRDDLYRQDGKCAYAELCERYHEGCEPEACTLWEAFFDGEAQADESLSE